MQVANMTTLGSPPVKRRSRTMRSASVSIEIEEICDARTERVGQSAERIDRHVEFTAFQAGHKCSLQVGTVGQDLLGELTLLTDRADASADLLQRRMMLPRALRRHAEDGAGVLPAGLRHI